MSRRNALLLRFGLLVTVSLLATMSFGWVGVLFVGVAFAAIDGRESAPGEIAAAAALAWILVLLFTALSAGARPVGIIAAALTVPVIAIPLASMLFAAGLAWSSAAVTLFLRDAVIGLSGASAEAEPVGR
jgi:hypothetical protein